VDHSCAFVIADPRKEDMPVRQGLMFYLRLFMPVKPLNGSDESSLMNG
jgi:hypothetical protein